jgi:putative FmdB family regulatory protein
MPIYEYECGACGRFEVLQKINEPPLSKCETCGRRVHRLVSLSSFALVGGGWYKDLYSSTSKDSKGSSESTSSSSASSTSSSSAKSEPSSSTTAKPEKKADSKASKSSTAAA